MSSLVPERHQRIDLRRSSCRRVARRNRDDAEQQWHADEGRDVGRRGIEEHILNEPRRHKCRQQADRGAREDDELIISRIAIRNGEVEVDDAQFWLGCGIEVKMLSARHAGFSEGVGRWRVALEITDPMPNVEVVESGEGPIENRRGHIFYLTAVGSPEMQ